MRRLATRCLLVLALGLAGVVAFSVWALEASDVARITTRAGDEERVTHVWYVEDGDALLLEAGSPENGWFVDVTAHPVLDFAAPGLDGRFTARPLPNPEGHRRIRRLLREKDGLRDAWIARRFDTGRCVAVALEPAPP
jgi:hypothetical protein